MIRVDFSAAQAVVILRRAPEEGQMCGEASNLKILLIVFLPPPPSCMSCISSTYEAGKEVYNCTVSTIDAISADYDG